MTKPLILVALVCFTLGLSANAQAGVFGEYNLGRHWGLGWSDGYHTKCRDCDCDCGGHGLLHRLLHCSDPCWHDSPCVKTKVVSPGCFGCGARITPVYEPGPVYYP